MGLFRTVVTLLTCRKCSGLFEGRVQFKTEQGDQMQEYKIDEVVADLPAGRYEGIADAFCLSCLGEWSQGETRTSFEVLAEAVEMGKVVARRATWHDGARDGQPELGLIVTVQDERPLTSAEILKFLAAPVSGAWLTFPARLHHEGIALWVGVDRVFPFTARDQAAFDFWAHHNQVVDRILRTQGWPLGGENDIDVPILIATDHRIGFGKPQTE
jgi:hypothetical protein